MTIKHAKTSLIADGLDTGLVLPSDWNADHTLPSLGELADVNVASVSGGNVLTWDAGASEWIAAAASGTGTSSIEAFNEGVSLGDMSSLNFVGSGVTATASGSDVIVTVNGATGFIGCKATLGALTANNTWQVVPFASEEFDTDGFHSTSSNTSRMTIPAGLGGKYLVMGHAMIVGSSVAYDLTIYKNGTGAYGTDGEANVRSAGHPDGYSASGPHVVLDLIAGDYVELAVRLKSGSMSVSNTWLSVVKLDSGKVGQGIGAAAYATAAQTLTTATWTALNLATGERFDTDGFHDPSTNSSRFTIPAGLGGKYVVNCGYTIEFNATNLRYLAVRVNGNAVTGTGYLDFTEGHSSTNQALAGSITLDLYPNDYVEVYAYQDSGGNLNVLSAWADIMRLDSGSSSDPRSNYAATTDPGVSDDAANGYSVGSQWLNTSTRVMYVCKDNTTSNAVWHTMSGNYISLVVNVSSTAYIPDADVPRVGAAYFRDNGNSGAGIVQWYRNGTYNSLNGVAVSNHGYEFRNTNYSGGTNGFSWFIENNTAGGRIGCKNNNSGFGRTFLLCLF
jgi:hypothetical protein